MKYKRKIVDDIEVCFSADWINGLESETHFIWYWNQANLVYENCSRDQNLLEIGVGTSLLSDLLKRRGWSVVTVDIDEEKKPDFCVEATSFDYASHKIDTILAFEIFEHIPLSTFQKLIKRLSDSNVNNIYFSLPWCERQVGVLCLKLPFIRSIKLRLSLSRSTILTPAHFWELSGKDKVLAEKNLVSIKSLKNLFYSCGYSLEPLAKVGYIQYFSGKKLFEAEQGKCCFDETVL